MRLIRYYVINKATGIKVYTHCKESKCKEYLASLADSDNYAIGHKWLSI